MKLLMSCNCSFSLVNTLLLFQTVSFHEIKVQALPPPKLTVNPLVITEADTVTFNCQTPSSVSASQCYFYTLSGRTVKDVSCLQTLTATELLLMAELSSPAEVEVTCSYTVRLGVSKSPYSDKASITINTLPPPKLTANPPVITKTDTVALNCQTPSSISMSQCFFYTLSGATVRNMSCLKPLSGTELLNIARLNPPAEVKVTCYYTVELGERHSASPYSDITSVTINSLTVSRSPGSTPVTPTTLTSEADTGVTPKNPESSDEKTAGTLIWKLTVVVAGCGVAVGVILLLSAVLRNQKRAGSEEVKSRESQNVNSETYYFTIDEEPATSVLRSMDYSVVKAH
ncbi:uncharacterized protein [Trachinotus anak]|uniref:uncharacterized protein isoform X2 n=1 Tax=Trachinotus anak TaxID=443729 RepID=UPI0039F1D7D8